MLLLVDTAGCGMEEVSEGGAEGGSKSNSGEAAAVMAHAERLIATGVPAASIGIITPYAAQVSADCNPKTRTLTAPDCDRFRNCRTLIHSRHCLRKF